MACRKGSDTKDPPWVGAPLVHFNAAKLPECIGHRAHSRPAIGEVSVINRETSFGTPGVTRSSIIELAKHEGIPVREEPVRPERLLGAAEVFLTGTTAGVWPVGSIDGQTIGNGEGGPVSARLRERFATTRPSCSRMNRPAISTTRRRPASSTSWTNSCARRAER